MKTNESKNLGIWLDHSIAYLIDPDNKDVEIIRSEFSPSVKESTLKKGEKRMHNKEQKLQEAYFDEIGNKILDYDEVLLFGPTSAKAELHNYLNEKGHFKYIKIDVASTDKMSENEKKAFVKKHFVE